VGVHYQHEKIHSSIVFTDLYITDAYPREAYLLFETKGGRVSGFSQAYYFRSGLLFMFAGGQPASSPSNWDTREAGGGVGATRERHYGAGAGGPTTDRDTRREKLGPYIH